MCGRGTAPRLRGGIRISLDPNMGAVQISVLDWSIYAAQKARAQALKHAQEAANICVPSGADLIVGCCHYLNLGDVALCRAVQKAAGLPCRIAVFGQPCATGSQMPRRVIISGGSVLLRHNIAFLRVNGIAPDSIIALGVDLGETRSWPKEDLEYLRAFQKISLRSNKNYMELVNNGGIDSAKLGTSLDNAFSLFQMINRSTCGSSNIVGINMLPHMRMLNGRTFITGKQTHWPHDKADIIQDSYVDLFHQIVSFFLAQGMRVRHFPFTPEDDLFAKGALCGLKVDFLGFTPSIMRQVRRMSACKYFIASRFHAMVFALSLQLPALFVCYARKHLNLAHDLAIPKHCLIANEELSFQGSQVVAKATNLHNFFALADDARDAVCAEVGDYLRSSLYEKPLPR